MPPKGWTKNKIEPTKVEVTQKPEPDIQVNPKPQIIQPISVEITSPSKPSRTSQPVKSTPHKTGAFLVDKKQGNKRTWMDRGMATLMAKGNPNRYAVED
jgi:hypothetical protein